MTDLRAAAQQALAALEHSVKLRDEDYDAMDALKAALEQDVPETDCGNIEPVAWMHPSGEGYDSAFRDHSTVIACTGNKWEGWIPLYTHPPRREWRGLTDGEMGHIYVRSATPEEFARAIEAALKEKNSDQP